MRLLRALSAALVLCMSLALVMGEPDPARAQDLDEARDDADQARRRADQASSLLSQAAARRSGIEDELAASLTRLSELNSELTRVSVDLEELRKAVRAADEDLARINEALTVQAVDAYVRAVTVSAANLIETASAESAIVAATNLETAIGDDQASFAELTVRRRQLDELKEEYLAEQREVAAVQEAVDAETSHLEALLAEADSDLAQAATAARHADAAYRAALDAVDLARAQEQERDRQAGRDSSSTTTTVTDPSQTATTVASTTTPTTIASTTTTAPTPAPVPGGPLAPQVERWRGLVSAYFPESRVDEALAVIACESNGDPEAYNPYSGAAGLFQFLPSSWATVSPSAGFAGASVFDPEANIGTAAWLSSYYETRGSDPWSPWTCRP